MGRRSPVPQGESSWGIMGIMFFSVSDFAWNEFGKSLTIEVSASLMAALLSAIFVTLWSGRRLRKRLSQYSASRLLQTHKEIYETLAEGSRGSAAVAIERGQIARAKDKMENLLSLNEFVALSAGRSLDHLPDFSNYNTALEDFLAQVLSGHRWSRELYKEWNEEVTGKFLSALEALNHGTWKKNKGKVGTWLLSSANSDLGAPDLNIAAQGDRREKT